MVGASDRQALITRQNPVRAGFVELGIRRGGRQCDHQGAGAFSSPNTGGGVFKHDALGGRNT